MFLSLFSLSLGLHAQPTVDSYEAIINDNWAPLNMSDPQGNLVGIKLDYLELMFSKANLEYHLVKTDNWRQVLTKLNNNESDFSLGGASTDDSEFKNLNYSKEITSFPLALAVNTNSPFVSDFSFLAGKKIAIGENKSARDFIERNYPLIKIVKVRDTYHALELLSYGEIDGAIDILPVLSTKIVSDGYSNIKIGGISSNKINIRVVLSDKAKHLLPEINKAIDGISKIEHQKLLKKWLYNAPPEKKNKYLVMAVIVCLCILTLIIIYLVILKFIHRNLKIAAFTDPLTNAFNRQYSKKFIAKQKKLKKYKGQQCALLFIDIDDFKKVNDHFGHDIGDKLLIEFVEFLKASLRNTDVVIRWGGEEFLIILPNTCVTGIKKVAEKLQQQILNNHFDTVGEVSVSGSYLVLSDSLGLNEQYKLLDNSLYQVKKTGKRRIVESKVF
ncbi:diguanylate cyclase [Thalassotalea psychrophila]|uniref:diguanylate cyclase n=1 Tax=Thalassotalea psychrophila TaxID=3065647 RepID=A0ABY9TT26_9GAMM|nr:diguanylate cyclase [Colwelliaceae bacterium SQ149]